MDDFYAARTANMAALPWSNFAPPFSIGRLRLDPKTQEYVSRRIAEGHSKLEAIRCVKRYIAREIFNVIARRHKQINQAQIAT